MSCDRFERIAGMNHSRQCGIDVRVDFRGGRGENGCAQTARLCCRGGGDRHVEHISFDLKPELAAGASSSGDPDRRW